VPLPYSAQESLRQGSGWTRIWLQKKKLKLPGLATGLSRGASGDAERRVHLAQEGFRPDVEAAIVTDDIEGLANGQARRKQTGSP
jgi:hypothetical protein